MIIVIFEIMGNAIRVTIKGKEVSCSGSADNFEKNYPLDYLIKNSHNKDSANYLKDLENHYAAMEKMDGEEDIYDYITLEFQKQGFRIIGEQRS
ncbi:hypothetical protein CMI37_31270 [Candidatus Pacearchaeota archaeon]|nr:hypothetical protein [Candidatus Pacearchaeota archaeon]|tara:strand:+ start:1035 stop:1316 length:282 start_codon:yes stop_codon:yes gene_type:complete